MMNKYCFICICYKRAIDVIFTVFGDREEHIFRDAISESLRESWEQFRSAGESHYFCVSFQERINVSDTKCWLVSTNPQNLRFPEETIVS